MANEIYYIAQLGCIQVLSHGEISADRPCYVHRRGHRAGIPHYPGVGPHSVLRGCNLIEPVVTGGIERVW